MPRFPLTLLPTLIDRLAVAQREAIDGDLERWVRGAKEEAWGWAPRLETPSRHTRLMTVFVKAPEFREQLYYRAGRAGVSPLLLALCRRLFPGPSELHLGCTDIGPGLFLVHAYNTIVGARKIGRNCRIHQNVTIGWTGPGQAPTIGDDVTIFVGAVVIGDITIGDRATIGANAVVRTDVPAGALAVGVPARVIERS